MLLGANAHVRTTCVSVCFSGKPTAPRNLRVMAVNKDSVSLTWNEPEHDGGSPIERYVVENALMVENEKRVVFTDAGYTSADTRQFVVTKLHEGNDYKFRVAAENEFGQGEPASVAVHVIDSLPLG